MKHTHQPRPSSSASPRQLRLPQASAARPARAFVPLFLILFVSLAAPRARAAEVPPTLWSAETKFDDAPGRAEISGDTLACGRRVFVRTSDGWALQQLITSSAVVAVIDGDTLVMRSDSYPGPTADLYLREGTNWTPAWKIAAPIVPGQNIAISGDTVVVGRPWDDSDYRAGVVRVYVRSGAGWILQETLTADPSEPSGGLGLAVAIDGDTLVVGAPGGPGAPAGTVASAYVFVRTGTTWTQQARLTNNRPLHASHFGSEVSISQDTVVVGDYADDQTESVSDDTGAAFVFVRRDGLWSLQQKLTASDALPKAHFGESVAIDGDTIVAGEPRDQPDPGAPGYQAGSAYVFTRSGDVWTERQKLTASDGASNEMFGHAVAISGQTVAIKGGSSAYVYEPVANVPPTVDVPPLPPLICSPPSGLSATVTAQVADADGDELTVLWSVDGAEVQTDHVAAGEPPTTADLALTHTFVPGAHTVRVEAFDGTALITAETSVTVEADTTPPVIDSASASPDVLWPPTQQMVPVIVSVQATDECDPAPTARIVAVASNQPENGTTFGDKTPDWEITGPLTVNLRAERAPKAGDRVYTITAECRDGAGNAATRAVTVTVPLLPPLVGR